MPSLRQQVIRKKILSSVAQLFFQGVVVLAPIGVTIWVVVSLFNWVDNFLPNLLNFIFPLQFAEVNGQIPKVTGLGFVVAITLVLVVGWLSSLFFVERLMSIFDKILEKYQIKISRYLDGNYLKNFHKEDDMELSELAHKLINGYNDNEVNLVPKNIENKGFFEKFFQLFS